VSESKTIRATIEVRILELNERANQIGQDLTEPSDNDWDDNAIETEDDEQLEGVGHAAVEETSQVKATLAAIASGTHGTCAEFKDKLAPQRLETLPMATKRRSCA
jgi:RNA polymerase-binding transcription factor DksA